MDKPLFGDEEYKKLEGFYDECKKEMEGEGGIFVDVPVLINENLQLREKVIESQAQTIEALKESNRIYRIFIREELRKRDSGKKEEDEE